ncbi:MAG: protein phosphatase CheZ [Acetobacteraceae bacterium]|jgi:chemotaxis protein CheZ
MSDPDLLAQRLAEIRSRHPGSQPEMVAEVVRVVLSTLSGDLSAQETSLLAEVEALGQTIARAKVEIAALRVDDITDNHIPFATDELDAIVDHTATATNAILSSCETLDEVARSLTGEPAERLQDATTRIYEACSFQDITGQRINKVVGTLKTIEAKVVQIVATFGNGDRQTPVELAVEGAAELLNGPQHPAVAMDQSDIDKLLASFE